MSYRIRWPQLTETFLRSEDEARCIKGPNASVFALFLSFLSPPPASEYLQRKTERTIKGETACASKGRRQLPSYSILQLRHVKV